jgi:hypothetical protein
VLESTIMVTLARGIRIDSSKGLFTPTMREMTSIWESALLDLLVLKDSDIERFWKSHWYFRQRPSDAKLREYRGLLQQLWSTDRDFLPAILADLVYDAHQDHRRPWLVESDSRGSYRIVPDYRVFALSLAFAVNNFQGRIATCENPECKQYFVKTRKTQKFCDRRNCLLYGQRKQKKEWWEKHGDEWRKNRAERKGKGTKQLKR